MIEFNPNDFQPLENFRLSWRWIGSSATAIPDTVLLNVQPVVERKAEELYDHSQTFSDENGLNWDYFTTITEVDACTGRDEVREWLSYQETDRDQLIFVSWDADTAVITDWGTFCDYWDSFCYPTSDDVVVCPFSQDWALFYHRDERLYFGR